jgi:hypothetical protein
MRMPGRSLWWGAGRMCSRCSWRSSLPTNRSRHFKRRWDISRKKPGPGSHATPTNIAVHESARARSAFRKIEHLSALVPGAKIPRLRSLHSGPDELHHHRDGSNTASRLYTNDQIRAHRRAQHSTTARDALIAPTGFASYSRASCGRWENNGGYDSQTVTAWAIIREILGRVAHSYSQCRACGRARYGAVRVPAESRDPDAPPPAF